MPTASQSTRQQLPIQSAWIGRCAATIIISCVALVAVAEEPPASKADAPAKPKKLVLFDGKTLEGWKKTEFGGEGEVRVEDGVIVMETGSSLTGITTKRKDLPTVNYELSFEARRLDGFDFFAAVTFPVDKSHATFLNGGWGGSVTGISSIDGYDASENSSGTFFDYKDKQWYKFRVRVTQRTIQCWADDEQVVDVDRTGREISTRIEADPSKPLGFACWETKGALKNIVLRTLTPAEAKKDDKAEGDEDK